MLRGSETTDIIVVGAGIAGASIAARLAGRASVILLDMEDQPGYHATGRSAASYEPTYGPPLVRALIKASGAFFRTPPEGFAQAPLLHSRGLIMLGDADDDALADAAVVAGYRRADVAEAMARHPLLRADAAAIVLIDDGLMDLDVEAVLRGFLGQLRRAGGKLTCKARVDRGQRRGGVWHLSSTAGDFAAPIVVNAAGAWADQLAASCGIDGLGLVPKRRSACIVAPPPGLDARGWPQVEYLKDTFYAKPSGGKLMISPSDEEPAEPHDAFADDLALAEAIDVYQRFFDHEVTRIERSWGGLRTFAQDGNPVIGFDRSAEGFFWSAGQGGYGIQTAPAWSEVAAALLLASAIPAEIAKLGLTPDVLSPARFGR